VGGLAAHPAPLEPASEQAWSLRRALARELRGLRSRVSPRVALAQAVVSLMPEFTLSSLRARAYRAAGFQIERRAAFVGKARFTYARAHGVGSRLVVRCGAVISMGALLNLDDVITLGRNVSLGPEVAIFTSEHAIGPAWRRMEPSFTTRAVTVDDGAWIGARSVILPGVRIGSGSIVAAGSVVTRDVPPNSIVRGNPAVVVRELAP
jgi:maltose O-acetyltransferase